MSFPEGSSGSSSPKSADLGQALSFFGMVADYAAGAAPEEADRVVFTADALARRAGLDDQARSALYFAARLRSAGVFGNPAFAKREPLGDRARMAALWDIPAEGARFCERVPTLSGAAADAVRWQAENWDGTGYPDQLRWTGIPRAAQLLGIARSFAATDDVDEALAFVSAQSGRMFGPESARTFVMWFHETGASAEPVDPPYGWLERDRTSPSEIIGILAECVDRHNGVPGRAGRVCSWARAVGESMSLNRADLDDLELAAQLYGIGELRSSVLENERFDPLGRLGVETRAAHASQAACLLEQCALTNRVAASIRARSEWYDGTGQPDGARHAGIPRIGSILSAAIAYDALRQAHQERAGRERMEPIARIETAAGTQFDPAVVRALFAAMQART